MIKTIFYSLIMLVILSTVCSGQTIHGFMRPVGALSDSRKGSFSSVEAGFSIGLPKRTGGFSGVTGLQYSWRLAEGYFVAGIVDRERKIEGTSDFQTETMKIIEQTASGFARDYFASKASVVRTDRTDMEFLGHKAIQVRVDFPDSVCIVRVFWIDRRAYLTGVLLAGSQSKFETAALAVFDTMKPASNEDRDILFGKMIDDNTPPSLPQTPAVPRAKTDAEDAGLRGKVKNVIQESQFVAGSRAGSTREKDSEDNFDANGYLLKRIEYSDTNGFPSEITVYGYIDRNRVSRSGHINFESSPGGILIEDPPSVSRRTDNRYDFRYGYKYGPSGELKEYLFYDNAGRVWTRTVCKFRDRQKDCVLYDAGGKVNRRWSEILDDRGNPVESTHLDSPVEDWTAQYKMKYEAFDETGNWTKRIVTKVRIFSGITREEWVMTEYRTISYY